MNLTEDWHSDDFRQNVITKINEIMQGAGQELRTVTMMEDQIYRKSKSKQDYLSMVNKLFMHFKDMTKRPPQQQQSTNQGIPQQNIAQNPLNALENLATQGNRPQVLPVQGLSVQIGGQMPSSNIMQNLNQQRPGQQMPGMRMQMSMAGMGPSMQQGNDMSNQQMGNTMNANGPVNIQMNTMGPVPQGQMLGMPDQMNGMMPNQMQINTGPMQMGNTGGLQMGNPAAMQMPNNAMNVQSMQQMNLNQMTMGVSHNQLNPMMNVRANHVGGAMNVATNNTPRTLQGMLPQLQPSPGPMQANSLSSSQNQVMGMTPQPNGPNQMLNLLCNMQQRPATPLPQSMQMFVNRGLGGQQQFVRQNLVPTGNMNGSQGNQQLLANQSGQGLQLPAPQMIPSPALLPAPSPQMPMIQPQQRNLRQPSPGSNLSTPGQISQNSPFNPHEEHLYREKYKQLTKYIEPLKRMVARIGNDDAEKITKMSKLLQILCNPSERVPLETLLKCEKALEKMEPCLFTGPTFTKSSNPLMEVLNTTLQSAIPNHTLTRTYKPSLEILFGTDICAPVEAKKRKYSKEKSSCDLEVPHVLQGEVARLDSRFKISLDPTFNNNKKSLKLICCLDDKRLPSVPPINVTITEKYPWSSPECSVIEHDYSTTPFLETVHRSFVDRIAKLPHLYSLSQLLDIWEISVRHACSRSSKLPPS